MNIKDLHYVEFKKIITGYSYVFVCRTGWLFRKHIKFTVRSKSPNVTWERVQSLMKQHNYFIHDLNDSGKLKLSEITLCMDIFNKIDIGRYGKDPEHWEELAEIARKSQIKVYDALEQRHRIKNSD
ncbi:MAG: hypothetical protein V3V74_07260 [Nitrosomonadaceae bacterium]